MEGDSRLQAAISHWAARFVANGVALADFEDVTRSLGSYDGWCRAWAERAGLHERLGRDALARGHLLTAGEALQRAGVYYHFAAFLFVHDQAQMRAAHAKAVACRQAALPYLQPPGERVEIPYAGSTLAAILRKPSHGLRPPVMVMAMGLDSTKEEMNAYEQPFLARGIATLAFDGPGQGEAQYAFAIRGDYEVPVKAVIDHVKTRADVDSSRIGMWGVSLGGYYAPRAAAFDKRIAACIALGGPFDFGAAWVGLPELTREAFRVRSHCNTEAEARQHAATLSLTGVAQNMTCPLFIVNGRQDRIIPAADAERLAREAKGPVQLMMIEDGNHIANNRAYRWRSQSADWMAEQLQASAGSTARNA
jgi:dipeptidyl aminopeptidase/acylaminoacyl peptidase